MFFCLLSLLSPDSHPDVTPLTISAWTAVEWEDELVSPDLVIVIDLGSD